MTLRIHNFRDDLTDLEREILDAAVDDMVQALNSYENRVIDLGAKRSHRFPEDDRLANLEHMIAWFIIEARVAS